MEQLNISLKQVDIEQFKNKLYDSYVEVFQNE